jgi:hypothetical protein
VACWRVTERLAERLACPRLAGVEPIITLDEGGAALDARSWAVSAPTVDRGPGRPCCAGCAWDEGLGAPTVATAEPVGADAPDALGLLGEGEVGWRRAVEVFIVLFGGLEALSFSSTRGGLRD